MLRAPRVRCILGRNSMAAGALPRHPAEPATYPPLAEETSMPESNTPQPPAGLEKNLGNTLDSTELRQLAEWADGERRKLYVIIQAGKNGEPDTLRVQDEEPEARPYITLDTSNRAKSRPSVTHLLSMVRTHPSGGGDEKASVQVHDLMTQFKVRPDAVFLTESAVEKFLIPYYASVNAANPRVGSYIDDVNRIFDGKSAPPSPPAGTGEGDADGEGEGETAPYALVHFPRSVYQPATLAEGAGDPAAPYRHLDHLAVLHMDERGSLTLEWAPRYRAGQDVKPGETQG